VCCKLDVAQADLKRTIRTTNVRWGYKLALSVRNPFFEGRLADTAYATANTDIQSEAHWQEVSHLTLGINPEADE
jgi:hypothetical protein